MRILTAYPEMMEYFSEIKAYMLKCARHDGTEKNITDELVKGVIEHRLKEGYSWNPDIGYWDY